MAPWESTPSTSIHEHPARCTGRDRSWYHGGAPNPRAYTSILCSAHGSMGQHPIHEHPRASCALHRQRSLMGPWESIPSTSIREHPAPTSIHDHLGHCTGRDRHTIPTCAVGLFKTRPRWPKMARRGSQGAQDTKMASKSQITSPSFRLLLTPPPPPNLPST